MTEARINAAISSSVIGLTRHIMVLRGIAEDLAYRAVLQSELYNLLCNVATRLFLVPNSELARLYDIEFQQGKSALYAELQYVA